MERLTIKEFESVECEPYVLDGVEYYGDLYGGEVINKLAEYEDLEEKGLLIKLPCKVGDTVWVIYANGDLSEQKVEYISKNIHSKEWNIGFHIGQIPFSNFGKTVFLTEEEAEQALAKMKEV